MRKKLLITALVVTVINFQALAQVSSYPHYYVVVGGFALQENAERFTGHVHGLNYPAAYGFNAERKLYYVYVRLTDDKMSARELVYRLREEQEFKKAWIYNGPLEGSSLIARTPVQQTSEVASHPSATENQEDPVAVVAEQPRQEESAPAITEATTATLPGPNVPETKTPEPAVPVVGKDFLFQLVSAIDGKPVNGTVRLLDSDKDQQYDDYKANERVFVPAPATGKLLIVCHPIGYKFFKRAISYENVMKSINGATVGEQQEIVLPIKLTPVKRGDYMDLEGVKFFEHSAIFTPESESQLTELVSLMENPRYKIRVHGHTNDEASREIITMGKSEQFFTLDPDNNHRSHGSARELSRHRAEVVKAYLVSKGIDPGRISTKGYGAMLAVYEHTAANERVEVEIVKY
jgi:outer membrane protein OmpA-like peptidoglycan-associated protein